MSQIATLPSWENSEQLRVIEALLFASDKPLSCDDIAKSCRQEDDVDQLLQQLKKSYAHRGVNLIEIDGYWAFRTAEDLSDIFQTHQVASKKLSQAALETLAIIAYHQPVTRAEIQQIRGVSASRGTLDVLFETGWITLKGRRRNVPGRPITYGTTHDFLDHFALSSLDELPGLDELKGAGLIDTDLSNRSGLFAFEDDQSLNSEADSYIDEEETLEHLIGPMDDET